MSTATAQRYTAIAVVLHWAIAFAIVFNLVLGFWMHISAEHGGVSQAVFQAFQLHKSVGLSVLALSLARLGWRLAHKPPPLPARMPPWERVASKAVHGAFYLIMIALPLSGWLYVSTGWAHEADRAFNVPTLYFGLFQVPHLFGLAERSVEVRSALSHTAFTLHYVFAYGAIALAALHVGAALKHHFIDRDEVMSHMVPGLSGPSKTTPPLRDPMRLGVLGAGLGLAALAAAALLYAGLTLGSGAPAVAPAQAAPQIESSAPAAAAPTPNSASESVSPTGASAPTGAPPRWQVDSAQSSIRFSGVHAGAAFQGAFSRWRADIHFDPENLEASVAHVTIETASAADGIPIHDNSLPEGEWFDVANHPNATFHTTSIRARSGGGYQASGMLTIKGHPIELSLPFALRIEGERAVMDGRVRLSRRAADLGMASDPDGEWVSDEIFIDVHVVATRVR